jgi:antirestriction protein ArdC
VVPLLKRFTVFNAAQCEGLPDHVLVAVPQMPEREIVPQVEAVIAATGADFRIGGSKAFYDPAGDYIRVPPQPAFFHQIDYYRTALHETGHWTGHAKRLNRDLSGRMGSKPYAREELVAEMASAFTCATLGIVPSVRHADYLGAWLDVLREDSRAIFRAASQAAKAADFVLGGKRAATSEQREAAE